MGRFSSSVFGGYKKAEVDEYVGVLMEQLAELKTQLSSIKAPSTADLEAVQNETEELRAEKDSLRSERNRLVSENTRLESELSELKARTATEVSAEETENYKKTIAELSSKLAKYEGSYESMVGIMSKAKKEADDLVSKAKADAGSVVSEAQKSAESIMSDAKKSAEQITTDARVEALYTKKKAEDDIKARFEEKEQGITMARNRVLQYVEAFNSVQDQILQLQKQLQLLSGKLPIYKEDLFSTEPLQIVDNAEVKTSTSVDIKDDDA